MGATFSQLETAAVVRALATGATSQLFRNAAFARSGVTDVGGVPLSESFQKGSTARIKRIKDFGAAQDFDPRSGVDAISQDAEYVFTELVLDRLFTKGHPVYSPDAAVATYVSDFSKTIGGALRKSFDDYLYNRAFRDYSNLPTTGVVNLASNAPLQITYKEDATGVLSQFDDDHLTAAEAILDKSEVPSDGRYGRVTPDGGRGIEQSSALVTGFAGAMATGANPGSQIISDGIGLNIDFMRRGFMVAKSNAVTGQSAVSNIGDGTPTSTVTTAVADTTVFFSGDTSIGAAVVPAGVVRLTIGTTAVINPAVAIGTICRLGAVNAPALAYGVIVRVDAVGKFVWIVPYNKDGVALVAAQIPAATVFSCPRIGSVNPFYHREHLLFATRLLQAPSDGSGAYAEFAVDPQMQIISQVFKGSYNVNQFRESIRGSLLCGAAGSDYRKSVLALAA